MLFGVQEIPTFEQWKGYTSDTDVVTWLCPSRCFPAAEHGDTTRNISHRDLVALQEEKRNQVEEWMQNACGEDFFHLQSRPNQKFLEFCCFKIFQISFSSLCYHAGWSLHVPGSSALETWWTWIPLFGGRVCHQPCWFDSLHWDTSAVAWNWADLSEKNKWKKKKKSKTLTIDVSKYELPFSNCRLPFSHSNHLVDFALLYLWRCNWANSPMVNFQQLDSIEVAGSNSRVGTSRLHTGHRCTLQPASWPSPQLPWLQCPLRRPACQYSQPWHHEWQYASAGCWLWNTPRWKQR